MCKRVSVREWECERLGVCESESLSLSLSVCV